VARAKADGDEVAEKPEDDFEAKWAAMGVEERMAFLDRESKKAPRSAIDDLKAYHGSAEGERSPEVVAKARRLLEKCGPLVVGDTHYRLKDGRIVPTPTADIPRYGVAVATSDLVNQ
jgi:hypothetical protein